MKLRFPFMVFGLLSIFSAAQAAQTDEGFVTKAAQDGMAEVELGKLAERRAESDSVKQYAEQLVAAHSASNEQLKQIAKTEKITLPKSLAKEDQKIKKELSSLSGAAFDQRFVQVQIEDHQKAIKLFEQEANKGKSAPLKDYARKTLPHLEAHLEAAKKLSAQTGGSTSTR